MPRVCVFCGRSPTTKEHVWPDWSSPFLAAEGPLPHFQQVVQEHRPGIDRSWRQLAYSMTTRAVCAGCNNGWMARLEERAKPLLEPMLRGFGKVLHREGQRTLATWALKTSMISAVWAWSPKSFGT
jgi:hypothetical protein